MGKYFTVEVKPTIPNVAAGQHAAFADDDLVFDWYAFDVPKGTNKLIHATMEIRPKGDAGSTVNEFDIDVLFAKTVNGNAPTSLGTVNSALTAGVNLSNHMVGFIPQVHWSAYEAHLDSTAFTMLTDPSTARFADMGMLFSGEPNSGTNVGYDRFYMAGVSGAALDFSSILAINNGTLDGDTFTVDGLDPRLVLAVGDVIAATTVADLAVSKSLGTVKSMPDANTIVLETTTENAILDGDFIYNTAPIKIELQFER
tara:strand:- start:1007 stop:1774 length:768 start_codon:yes stop_codon:yes gene_type:complete